MGNKKYAAGLVVYRIVSKGIFEYLLLKASYPPYHWTPPKGHVDPGEEEHLVTAWRETEEEAGLSKDDLTLKDFKEVIKYDVKGKPKEVTYWLAELTSSKPVRLSDEHTDYVWAESSKAIELIGFPTSGNVIRKCQAYLEASV